MTSLLCSGFELGAGTSCSAAIFCAVTDRDWFAAYVFAFALLVVLVAREFRRKAMREGRW